MSELKKILLVDDNKGFTDLVEHWLGDRYTLAVARDGKTGLDMAEELHPDLLLVDLMMPEVSGVDLLRALRETEDLSTIPVVVITACGETQKPHEMAFLRPRLVLQKPLSAETLLDCIEAILKSPADG